MPLLPHSTYHPPALLANGHLQTIYPSLWRRVPPLPCHREQIATRDDDFLDLDWVRSGRERLAILTHGLEGSSHRHYIRGMARALHQAGWDILAWNLRGCGGQINRQLRFYHSGATEDLEDIIHHALAQNVRELALVGFSLGGNLILKYLAEGSGRIPSPIRRCVVFSVPCDLASSALQMTRFINRIYMAHFLRSLHRKLREKSRLYPGRLQLDGYRRIRTFREFDGRYTAPLHGFKSAAG